MSNEKRFILLVGAIIVTALWFRVLAVSAYPPNDVFEATDQSEVMASEPTSLEKTQVALNETVEFSKICTSGNGLPVSCSEFNEDTMCLILRNGAHSGIKVDCNTDQPIPADEYGASGVGGAKYRSPY